MFSFDNIKNFQQKEKVFFLILTSFLKNKVWREITSLIKSYCLRPLCFMNKLKINVRSLLGLGPAIR